MRKRVGSNILIVNETGGGGWLDLEDKAEIEVTSEDPKQPIEFALSPGHAGGWIAGTAGRQMLRIVFDAPRSLRLIHLVFTEEKLSRTQEFALRWSAEEEGFEQILRQQYNFSPGTTEVEDYAVQLEGVKALELEIEPSIGGGECRATLAELRVR